MLPDDTYLVLDPSGAAAYEALVGIVLVAFAGATAAVSAPPLSTAGLETVCLRRLRYLLA